MREGRPEDAFRLNYRVRHPRGASHERRSSRRRLPSKVVQLDTYVVHVIQEGRP